VLDATKSKFNEISFQRVNIEDPKHYDLDEKYGSRRSIPRLVLLDAGGKLLYNGPPPAADKGALTEFINRYQQ
jgi:hypothetical protein